MTTSKLERMFRAHANIKAKRTELSKAHKEVDGPLKKKLELIETALLQMMNEIGTSQLKVTGVAIAIPKTKVMPNCKDWQGLWTHIIKTGNFDLMARRLSSTGVRDYMDAHEGELPPGIVTHIERGVTVTRQN
jgi:hypothetical protein